MGLGHAMSDVESVRNLDEPWCGHCPFREVRTIEPFTEAELELVEAKPSEVRTSPAGAMLIVEDKLPSYVYLLTTGWAQRYILLPNGQQVIVQLYFPGDVIGYDAALLAVRPHYSVTALTAVTCRVLDRKRLAEAFTTTPEVARKLSLRIANRDRLLDYRLLNLSRHRVDRRLATTLLYIFARLRRLGLLKDGAFSLPLSQQQIADIVGAHVIHINRVLRQLRETGLVTVQKGEVRIHDLDGLRRFGCFCADREASN
jgi:CRP/FNR family transcriptional regulator